ncbi:lysophospholipase NTE1 [Polyplosphaeria fusca]|uniref:Lysophospholipase NTE1 n=1 Tax=Polyplosphaeria fusca TaxID=682080 RepID=A0A9P4QSZ9_9PLEO|nr:lysophospholipase NTE1 [Polyplosphaeria fusca]
MATLARTSAAVLAEPSGTMSAPVPSLQALEAAPSSTFGLLGHVILTILRVIPGTLYWIVTFSTITLPTWLFTLFSMSLTFTMNFTTLMLILIFIVSTISYLVRYRFMTMYTRLPPEPQRDEPQVEVFPDSQEDDRKRGLSNYLDEFLSAIKVFGYLERPVFHELTRTMQTRKLIAGETLLLEEEKGFCLVVDGLVQIFVRSNREEPDSDEEESRGSSRDGDRHGHSQGYQLLTEVKNGAPMSSLFSILSLFTEDVKLRHEDEDDRGIDSSVPNTPHGSSRPERPSIGRHNSFGFDDSRPGTPGAVPQTPPRGLRDRRASHLASPTAGGKLQSIPPLTLDNNEDTGDANQRNPQKPQSRSAKPKSAHPDIVARATIDTTIAVIPATAFRRLTRLYPKATAHIVQVILTRLQRVTLATGHAYLGLTSEVLRTEKLMNKYTTYDLPDFLRDSALERLKEKFAKERERIGREEIVKGIALHNPGAGRQRRASTTLRRGAAAHARLAAARGASMDANGEALLGMTSSELDESKERISPGDLLVNTHLPRGNNRRNRYSFSQPYYHEPRKETRTPLEATTFNPFASPISRPTGLHRQDSVDEATIFRESVLECMFKAIGLTNLDNTVAKTTSVEQSPRLVSYDARRQKAIFTNAFGFIDPYEASRDGDTESIISASGQSAMSMTGNQNILEELVNDVEIVFFPKGAVLVEQGEWNPGLYYVIDGFLDVSLPVEEDDSESDVLGTLPGAPAVDEAELFAGPQLRRSTTSNSTRAADGKKKKTRRSLFLTKPGGLAGYLGTVSSYRSFIDVTAKTDVYVGFLPRASIERIVDRYPVVLLTMAKRLTSLLPRLILHIDFALEWVQVNAGQIIYNQGDESDAIYIVLNGRLRAIQDGENHGLKVIGEYGQGDSIGELEVLTESARPGSLHAIRDTEVAKFPKTLFNSLALEHPGITIKISKIIASRMRALIDDPLHEQAKERTSKATRSNVSSTVNLRTVAILPVTAGVPVVEFSSRLMNALTQIGTPNGVVSLNQAAILNHLGRHAFNRMGKLKLSQYLADLEEKYGLVLYVADTTVKSPWTQTCISQADCILLVGLAENSANIGEYERLLLTTKTTARKELVILHPERFCPSGLTRKWLRNRPWINGSHHHIQMSFRTAAEPAHPAGRRFQNALKQRVQVIQAEIQKYTSRKVRQTPLYSAETPFKGDFHRLARRLCGKSVGLVLGGGGARGISQIGIIRALEEAGIPIDIVGGTSIGAFIGALYAWDADVVPMYGRAKKFAGRMGSIWRFALDLTYPSASYTTGHEFNRGIYKTFGTSQMEDFWLEFYCNTTNISKSRSDIHTSGYVWRYVRASMSLAGLLPPLCDNGNMLLDGGYIDNLTVTHMKSLGADVIFAVDVGSLDDDIPQSFGDSLSGFWAIWNRWNPFSSYTNPPTLSDIQSRLAYVSSYDALERAKNTPGCRYMRPPIDGYGTLEFAKFDEIYRVGYEYGKKYLGQLKEQGVLPVPEETEKERNLRRTMAPRRASI